jgi:hypothetical protein
MTTKITEKNVSNFANLGVQWQSIITADGSTTTTAVAGRGYFIDTTSFSHTINLPASATLGDTIIIKDYAGTANSNNIIVGRNGHNIQGVAVDGKLDTNKETVTLVYADSTRGWLIVNDQTASAIATPEYVAATGGSVSTVATDFKVHTFTSPGSFIVSNGGNVLGSNSVDYFVLAGGGGGSPDGGGGGGAGGWRESFPNPATGGLAVSATTYPVTVGGGGTAQAAPPEVQSNAGSNSVFSNITAAGGGYGGGWQARPGGAGGSGGGGNGRLGSSPNDAPQHPAPGAGNTPPVSPPQGNDGGWGGTNPGSGPPDPYRQAGGGGGGGAGGAGENGRNSHAPNYSGGGNGGSGASSNITGSPFTKAGGGGGGAGANNSNASGGSGSPGGGGSGGPYSFPNSGNNGSAAPGNSGSGGGGGAAWSGDGANGGSGYVVVRYKFQN